MTPTRTLRILATTLLVAVAAPMMAQDHHAHHRQMLEKPADSATESGAAGERLGAMSIPDTLVVDQDGREIHFYTDLVKGRMVAMNFIFTTCTTICPPMGANFSKLQQLLAERGRDLELISVSVDPTVDTPPRLKQWAEKFGRQEGWTLVTGSKVEVDKLLKALKVFTPDKNDHSPIVLVGDDARGDWTRAYGLAPAATLADMVEQLVKSSHEHHQETGR